MLFGYLVCSIQSQLYSFPSVNRRSFAVFGSAAIRNQTKQAKPNPNSHKLPFEWRRRKKKWGDISYVTLCETLYFRKAYTQLIEPQPFWWIGEKTGAWLWFVNYIKTKTKMFQDFTDFVVIIVKGKMIFLRHLFTIKITFTT